jgi:hypothetical protein
MITTWSEFFDLVCAMRKYQTEYFRDKSAFALVMAQTKEKEVDACIEYQKKKRANKQLELRNITEGKNG